MPKHDDVTLGLAKAAGWTDEQADALCRHVNMPLSGMRHSLLSAEMLVTLAMNHQVILREAVLADRMAGVLDFDEKDGEKRRRIMLDHGREMRSNLREARQHYAQAAFFQARMRDLDLDGATVVETEPVESEDERERRERAEELAARIDAAAREAASKVAKSTLTKLERQTDHGKRLVDRITSEAAAEFEAVNGSA